MNTKQLLAGVVGALKLLFTSAVADYSADQPLTQYQRGMTYGDLVYVAAPPGEDYYTPLDAGDHSIAVDTFDVCPVWELQKTGNFVEIRDSGDYMVPSNAFLVVNYY